MAVDGIGVRCAPVTRLSQFRGKGNVWILEVAESTVKCALEDQEQQMSVDWHKVETHRNDVMVGFGFMLVRDSTVPAKAARLGIAIPTMVHLLDVHPQCIIVRFHRRIHNAHIESSWPKFKEGSAAESDASLVAFRKTIAADFAPCRTVKVDIRVDSVIGDGNRLVT